MANEEPLSVTDGELVTRAQKGDAGAFEALVSRYRRVVYGLCLHRVGDPDEANDLAQESFVRAYQEIGGIRCPDAFAGWLRRVATNVCSAWLRRNRPLVVDPSDLAAVAGETSVEETAVRRLAAHRVREALSVLSEPVRLTVTLFYLDGYSYQEIARFLEAPVETVRGRLRDARRRLRKELWDMAEETTRASQPGPEFERAVARRVEVAEWYRSFSEMIQAGVSLIRCLYTLESDPFSPPVKAATRRMIQAIEKGDTLSQALLQEPLLADKMVVGMVRAGEIGGVLDQSFKLLDQWQRIDEAMRRMELALWCRTLGMLLTSGVPILQALETVAELSSSSGLREATLRIRAGVREARSMGEVVFAEEGLFPTEIALMLVAGECGGDLDTALLDASALLVADLNRAAGQQPAKAAPRRYLDWLQGVLEERSPEQQLRAAAAMGRPQGDGAIPVLAEALRKRDPGVGEAVVRLFAYQAPERAIPILTQACRSDHADTRLAGTRALGQLGAGAALDPLLALATDPDPRVRHTAVRALAQSGDPACTQTLVSALADPDTRVVLLAVDGLKRIGLPAADAVLALLQGGGDHARAFAADIAGTIDTPRVRERLRAALSDPDASVRYYAGTALQRYGEPAGTDVLIDLTRDSNSRVRANATAGLRGVKDPRMLDVLVPLLKDPDLMVHRWASEALGTLGDSRAVPALVELLAQGPPSGHWANCSWAADALAKIGDPSALPLLRDLAGAPDGDPKMRQYAENAIKALTWRQAAG